MTIPLSLYTHTHLLYLAARRLDQHETHLTCTETSLQHPRVINTTKLPFYIIIPPESNIKLQLYTCTQCTKTARSVAWELIPFLALWAGEG